ncbi:hypothetical protein VTL71DRAFT_409 [Oculimacula yallundae]|uniref:Uncharacterized protein n=1 Tax=Oculimacula yallundae TaxID=86028 RepID=A0ABR4D289_9HELO
MEECIANLLPRNKILAAIIYYPTLFTLSALFAFLFLSTCAGCTIKELLDKPHGHDTDDKIQHSTKSKSSDEMSSPGKVTGGGKQLNDERASLRVGREVYRDSGVENACVLNTSESEIDERDALLRLAKEEGCSGYRNPTCETDDEG